MMAKEVGDKRFEIWLLGDSNPKHREDDLSAPLDARHPIRHNIWTSVMDVVQDRVFRELGRRVDCSTLYTSNAVQKRTIRPALNETVWWGELADEVENYHRDLEEYRPKLVFSFGRFAFEFARRALNEKGRHSCDNWGAKQLGEEFLRRMDSFDLQEINLIPLLHRSASGGQFIERQWDFCGHKPRPDDLGPSPNYFDFVGGRIAEQLIKHHDDLRIWIEPRASGEPSSQRVT